jgi:alkyl sulfatase BDS1-like metallo-beta-lactamase superfamily hydrolase
VLDQSLRGILGGKGPDELRHLVRLPDYLQEVPNNLQSYGEVSSYPPAIYYQSVGWYDNDAAHLQPVSSLDEAQRIVPLMGGWDSVLAAAEKAMDKKENAWAAQLVNHLYQLDPRDAQVRQLKAAALRRMAYVSTGANNRAHLMSQALALEGKVTLPRVVPPPAATIAAFPATFVDYFRVRIDPARSGETDRVLRFDFPDGTSAGLHVRRAIAEFIEDPAAYPRDPDIVLQLSGEAWARVYLSAEPIDQLIAGGDIAVTTGDAAEAARVLNLFDRYDPARAVVVPAASLVHDHM